MERVSLVKQEALVYEIPSGSGTASEGWKATKWNLNEPDWIGRLKLLSRDDKSCSIRLEDSNTNKIYAECVVDSYPGSSIVTVLDSSRYFVIRTSTSRYLGLGFTDRSDSFDLNVALQSHFKGLRIEEAIQRESEEPRPGLDLALKEGQTIKVNINIPHKKRSRSPAIPHHTVAAAQAAGIAATSNPRFPAPPTKHQANPNWIQF